MMQCLLLTEGDAVFMGVKSDSIPGQNFHDKRVALLRMNVEDIRRLLSDSRSSWLIRFEDGLTAEGHCGVLIPSGFCVLSATSHARYIRWSLVADNADMNRAEATLQQMLDEGRIGPHREKCLKFIRHVDPEHPSDPSPLSLLLD
jgi:hypothetical protein